MFKTKKNFILLAVIAILVILSNSCFAATVSSEKASFEIVENNVCTIQINDTSTFEKKIVSYDLEKKEVDIQLKVTNNATPIINKPTEIMFVIDNSLSMVENAVVGYDSRMDAVVSSAKKLATSLLDQTNLIKIGVVSFSTGPVATQGTVANDAELRIKASSSKADVLNAIEKIKTDTLAAKAAGGDKYVRTDIEAGLTLAGQNFSDTCESKYMILLSDGVPNVSLGSNRILYSGETSTRTKAKLQSLANEGVTIFTVMAGVNSTSIAAGTEKTYREIAEEIFGTEANPTVGKFYYISDNQIDRTISQTVLSNFQDETVTTLTNLKIYDYFPQDIVDNFNFSYVSQPTKGTISNTIDPRTNSIVWTIDKLEAGESATVVYKLKLKDNIDEKILNVVLNTNEKVDITADELDDPTSSKVTPKVRVNLNSSTVTVKYVEKDTNKELAKTEVISGNVDDDYRTVRKTIPGYIAAEPEPTNKEGKITEEPITVIYYYTKAPATVTIKYIDKDTNKPLAKDDVVSGNIGDEYKAARKPISGYQAADPEPKNTSGKMTEEPITVIYYYSKVKDNTVAPDKIPQTGTPITFNIVMISAIILVTIVGIRAYILNRKIK